MSKVLWLEATDTRKGPGTVQHVVPGLSYVVTCHSGTESDGSACKVCLARDKAARAAANQRRAKRGTVSSSSYRPRTGAR